MSNAAIIFIVVVAIFDVLIRRENIKNDER